MYQKVDTNLNFVQREKKTKKFWDAEHIFEKSMKEREGSPMYTFYDGPPYGQRKAPHRPCPDPGNQGYDPPLPHHEGLRSSQKGRMGTPTALPVELEVEKKLGLNGKEQIEEYGIEPFIKECKESVWKYKGMWEDFSGTVGFWADMEHPYVTYDNTFIESEWWALKEIWKKGLLYKGFKIVPYCPPLRYPSVRPGGGPGL